jgi:hypothetical protein
VTDARPWLLALPFALALAGCALVVPQPDVPPAAIAAPARVFAGAARLALTPVPHAVPLAGFGPHPTMATESTERPDGSREDLFVRALSLRGAGEIDRGLDRVVLVSIDSLIVPPHARADVIARLGSLARTELILTATHTHFGIGGFWKGTLPEWASIGPYDAAMTARLADRVAATIREAIAREEPVRVARGSTRREDLVASRAAQTELVDPDLLALAFDGERGRVATLVVFAAHPTELYGSDRLSPAWPGAFSAALEREGGVALLLQGGLGNQKPRFPMTIFENLPPPTGTNGRLARSRAYGATVARAASEALVARPREAIVTLALARADFALPFPSVGACPFPILARVLAVPVALPYWPERTQVQALRIGDAVLAFAPFELVSDTTLRTKERLRAAGFADVAVVSLADGWLGYAPDGFPWPFTTSGAASFGGTGIGYVLGERLAELGETIAPR